MSFIFSRKNYIIILLSAAVLSCIAWHFAPKKITRAAIDVGSGSIKLTIAEVDSRNSKISRILYSREHAIPFKRDIQVGGQSVFSDKIQKVALDTLSNLQKELAIHSPTEWKGIATAASRQAKNAPDLFKSIRESLGIDISIISQNEEGRLGFETASAVSNIPPEKLIAVDSGSGSFQITTMINDEIEVIEGALGYIPSLEILMELRGQQLDLQTSPATVTLEEAQLLVERMRVKMPPSREDFLQKSRDITNTIVGIGNENFIFAMGSTGVGKKTFNKEELWQAISHYAGRPAEELTQFAHPDTAVLGMVLLYSIMDSMGLDQITACYANGSCEGLLVNEKYWSQS